MLLCRTCPTGFGLDFERLLAETPIEVFEQWRVLYGLEPWAEERADIAVGVQLSWQSAWNRATPKNPVDYMPYLRKEPPKPQSEKMMQDTWEAICRTREQHLKEEKAE